MGLPEGLEDHWSPWESFCLKEGPWEGGPLKWELRTRLPQRLPPR